MGGYGIIFSHWQAQRSTATTQQVLVFKDVSHFSGKNMRSRCLSAAVHRRRLYTGTSSQASALQDVYSLPPRSWRNACLWSVSNNARTHPERRLFRAGAGGTPLGTRWTLPLRRACSGRAGSKETKLINTLLISEIAPGVRLQIHRCDLAVCI